METTTTIPDLKSQKQEDCCKDQGQPCLQSESKPSRDGYTGETLSQNTTKEQKAKEG